MEDTEDQAQAAQAALAEADVDNVAVVQGPLAEGAAKHGPYDVILIQGGVESVPDALLDQLKDGGRLVAIFEDGRLGTVRVALRADDTVTWRYAFNADAPILADFRKSVEFAL